MDKKKIPFVEKEDEKPLFPEIYMEENKTSPDENENSDTNIKYSNRMLF